MVKKVIKVMVIVILVFTIALFSIWHFYLQDRSINEDKTALPTETFEYVLPTVEVSEVLDLELIKVTKEQLTPLEEMNKRRLNKLISESERVNVVLFSHDGKRADTIILMSFDPVQKEINIVNVPRDTYWPVEGYMFDVGNQRINAVYGRGNGLGGSKGVKEAIANLLQIPVHYFVKLDYEGAEAIIDSFGGVEINVEDDLKYDDTYAIPPLHIDIKAGFQLLDGHNSVDYLRWRKNNGEIGTGDLPRIERMQAFADKALDKIVSPKLPSFISSCVKHVYTDFELDLLLSYALKATDVDTKNTTFESLPGKVEGDFYVMDYQSTQNLLLDMYSNNEL